jgi:hypothetical protein
VAFIVFPKMKKNAQPQLQLLSNHFKPRHAESHRQAKKMQHITGIGDEPSQLRVFEQLQGLMGFT